MWMYRKMGVYSCRKMKALEFLGLSIWETKIIKFLVG